MIYPLLTWLVPVPSFTIDVTIDGTTETLSVPDGAYYGWLTTGSEFAPGGGLLLRSAADGSLSKALGDVLATHSRVASIAAYYGETASVGSGVVVTPGSGGVGMALDIDCDDNPVIDATSDAAALRLFGLEVGDVLFINPAFINRRTAGVWRPKFAPPARLEPLLVAIGSGAISEYSAATQDRLLFGGRLIWSVVWEYVEAADISRELLTVADYLPVALRAPGDTRGTLDDLLWAMAQGAVPLLALPPKGTAAIDYREVIVDVSGSIDRGAYTTEAAVGARRYNVTMTFTETQDYDPESTL